ncbi:MAG: hypothetical protein IJ815_00745 [Lachnospiraceae bacterium]|nr:hypothetical protein [Lachnospiraceae bacterium]
MQVLGCLMLEPTLLDEYHFEPEDFKDAFSTIIYGAVNNLYSEGIRVIDKVAIDNYLSAYPQQYSIFTQHDGMQYVDDCRALAEKANFTYYHQKLKKLAYLRYAGKNGLDIRPLYDYSLTGTELEKEQKKFDAMTIEDLISRIESKFVIDARNKYSISTTQKEYTMGNGLSELISELREIPDYGIPLVSPVLNTIYRGARFGTVYLISAPSGVGKTRVGVQNMVYFSVPWQYNNETKKWETHGISNPSLIISTELEHKELQTMVVAQVSGVSEDKILAGSYDKSEQKRIEQAIEYIKSSPLYTVILEDFSREQVFNIIRKYHRECGVDYVYFDYIQMSFNLMNEMVKNAQGVRIREDQILYQFVSSLKALARQLNIFILSATQLSGTYHEGYKDETILRGAKAMADKIDCGEIIMIPTAGELKAVDSCRPRKINMKTPNRIKHIYKCRGGKYTTIKVFCYMDLGKLTCEDLFVTDADNILIDIPYTNISVGEMKVGDMDVVEQTIKENSVDMSIVSDEEVFEKLSGQEKTETEDVSGLSDAQLAMRRLGF